MSLRLFINTLNLIIHLFHHREEELPSAEELANKFLKRGKFKTDHTNTSWLFMFFAQHFTHEFFKTIYHKPAFSWGNHGVDVSHIYGQDVERQNKLRSFEDGKLKSQVKLINSI